jgi:hypothetical protein
MVEVLKHVFKNRILNLTLKHIIKDLILTQMKYFWKIPMIFITILLNLYIIYDLLTFSNKLSVEKNIA